MKIANHKSQIANVCAFTLIELMVALTLVVLASTMVCMTFAAVTKSWRRGTAMADDLHHGDYVMDQLALALRSAYCPNAGGGHPDYGFRLEDNGSGAEAFDSISWVKRGYALTGSNSPTVSGPHRVEFLMAPHGDDGQLAPAVRIWRPYALAEDFDPTALEPVILSSRISGFDCRVATNRGASGVSAEWDWLDTWEDDATNRLPHAVEITLYLAPKEEGDEPMAMRRAVSIPVAHLSWKTRRKRKPKPSGRGGRNRPTTRLRPR